MSQASSVAMESGCLWPQKLTQDLRAHTQTLALSFSGTARDRADPREQEVRDGERERASSPGGQSKELKEGKGGGRTRMLRPIGRAHPKSGDTEQVNLKDLRSPSPLPGPSLPAVQDGDHCGDTLGRASKLLGVEWYWDKMLGKGLGKILP